MGTVRRSLCLPMRSIGSGLVVAIVLHVAAAPVVAQLPQTAISTVALERVEALAREEFQRGGFGSLVIGVVRGPQLVWSESFGYADIEQEVPAARENVYRIGSITKQFTALMLLQLVDDGTVHLTDAVEKYVPEILRVDNPFKHAPSVTLVQLSTMTSGLAREPSDLPTYLVGPVERWEDVMISALEKTRFIHEPGTRYAYSNIGYAVLGAALSRAAEEPFVDYVTRQILTPLAMHDTAFAPNDRIQSKIAAGYELRNGMPDRTAPDKEHAGRGYKVPNGALYSTVDDLAKFVAFLYGEGPDEVLPRQVVRENLAHVASAEGDLSSGYGIGFRVTRKDRFVAYGHGGSVAGYRAAAEFDPATKTGVVVLRNLGRGGLSELALASLEIIAVEQRNIAQPVTAD